MQEHKNPVHLSYSFYISAGSKDLLKHINGIMRRNGYLGLADGGGTIHYVIDGSKNLYETANNIEKLMLDRLEKDYDKRSQAVEKYLEQRHQVDDIQTILLDLGFKASLKGFLYLSHLLNILIEDANKPSSPDKVHYIMIAEKFNSTKAQVDRVINYALKKANYIESNAIAISELLNEVKQKLEENKKR